MELEDDKLGFNLYSAWASNYQTSGVMDQNVQESRRKSHCKRHIVGSPTTQMGLQPANCLQMVGFTVTHLPASYSMIRLVHLPSAPLPGALPIYSWGKSACVSGCLPTVLPSSLLLSHTYASLLSTQRCFIACLSFRNPSSTLPSPV